MVSHSTNVPLALSTMTSSPQERRITRHRLRRCTTFSTAAEATSTTMVMSTVGRGLTEAEKAFPIRAP
jgi:hypothetical protein